MSGLNLKMVQEYSLPVLSGFEALEPKKWTEEMVWMELFTEIGSLGRALTIWEGYRHGRKSQHQLLDELSDIFFVLIRIARDYKIELPERIEAEKVRTFAVIHRDSVSLFEMLICDAYHLKEWLTKLRGHEHCSTETARLILDMILLVCAIAAYYKLPFEPAHYEEMRLARTWQNLFFESKFIPRQLKKVLWFGIIYLHERKLDHLPLNQS